MEVDLKVKLLIKFVVKLGAKIRIGLPKMHSRIHIGLPKMHGGICIGLPKVHGRFRIGTSQNFHPIWSTRFSQLGNSGVS